MTPDDLSGFSSLSDPQLHPDGVRIAFVVSRMDLEKDKYLRTIWLWDGTEARIFTHGPADNRPRWSPDGESLAFLRSSGEPDSHAQLAVLSASGGEATVMTDFALGVSEAEWSPDGSTLALIASTWDAEAADLDADERKRSARRITGPGYRFDNRGWLSDRDIHVYAMAPGGEPAALTSGPFRHAGVTWHPDGDRVAFLSARHERRFFDSGSQPFEVPAGGGDAVALLTTPGYWERISYSPDCVAHLVGHPDAWNYPRAQGVWRVDDGETTELAPNLDRNFAIPAPPVTPGGPQWLDDGSFRALLEDRNTIRVVEVHPDGTWDDILGGDRLLTGMTTRPDGSAMAMISVGVADPGELVWWEGGEERTLTNINEAFRAQSGLIEPETFTIERDGVEIDGWVFLPPGDGPVPVLLNIHGGPATQYGWGFFDEFQVYVGAGYGVVACNPRGSSGRGTDFVRVPVGRWAEDRPPDLEDLLAFTDAALERFDRLDPDRVGIMGGSYGGMMTARILAVDSRWKSAVAERGLYSFTSFAGTSDIGFRFPRMYLGEWSYEDWGPLWDASPLSRAHAISTPTLIIHSEADYRCPIEQGEQLFSVLIDQGVEAEMLRFSDSSHELSRGGKPKYRRDRFQAILEWHGRHLGVTT